MSPRRSRRATACVVGAVFGLVYVVANAGGLAPGVALALRAAAGLAVVVVLVLLRRARVDHDREPGEGESLGRGYWTVVAVEVAVGLVGAAVLAGPVDAPQAVLPWITAS